MTGIAPRPRLGVIGGLGPLATADFYRKFTELTPAARDVDHIPAVLLSLPQVPDRSAAILTQTDAPYAGLVYLSSASMLAMTSSNLGGVPKIIADIRS